jgi:hypothetical protein
MTTYTVVSVGAAVTGGGVLAAVTPGTHASGDLLMLVSASRTTTATSTTDPSGYSLLGAATGGTGFELWGIIATSGAMPAVSIGWGSTALAYIVALRSSDGWPPIGSIVVDSHSATNTVTGANYQDLTVTEDDCLIVQAQTKATTSADVNPATAVAVTATWTSAGAKFHNIAFGMLTSAQVKGQTTKTNVTDNAVAVTGNTDSQASRGISLSLRPGTGATQPVITDVDTDEIVTSTQTNVVITGTDFGASGTVELVDGTVRQTLAQDSWGATSIQVDMSLGNCRYGARTLVVTTVGGLVATRAITVNPPTGLTATTMAALRSLAFDTRGKPTRIYDVPDIPNSAQVEMQRSGGSGSITVDDDGRIEVDSTVTQIKFRWNSGTGWSAFSLWDWDDLFPVYVGPDIPNQTFTNGAAITPIELAPLFTNEAGTPLTYSLGVAAPTGLTLNTATGRLSGSPTVDATTTSFKPRATNAASHYDEALTSFSIAVQTPPNAPAFSGTIPNLSATVGTTFSIDFAPFFSFATGFVLNPNIPGLNLVGSVLSGTLTTVGTVTSITVTGTGIGTPAVSNAFSFETVPEVVTPQTAIPDLAGLTLIEVLAALDAAGFSFGAQTNAFHETVELGTVFAQSPVAGTLADAGTVVDISVSLGPTPIVTPPPVVPPPVVPKTRRGISLRKFLITG